MPIRPILDKIVVLPTSSIDSPTIAVLQHGKPVQGVIKGTGPLVKAAKVGDTVYYKETSGHQVHVDGKIYRVIKESEILAIDPH